MSDATIDLFEKFTGKVLDTDVKVTSITDNTIGYYGNGTGGVLKSGVPVVGTHYTIRYNLRKTTPTIGLDYLLSDVPNTFVDKEEQSSLKALLLIPFKPYRLPVGSKFSS